MGSDIQSVWSCKIWKLNVRADRSFCGASTDLVCKYCAASWESKHKTAHPSYVLCLGEGALPHFSATPPGWSSTDQFQREPCVQPAVLTGGRSSTQQESSCVYFGSLELSYSSWVKATSESAGYHTGFHTQANYQKAPSIFKDCSHHWGKKKRRTSLCNTTGQTNQKDAVSSDWLVVASLTDAFYGDWQINNKVLWKNTVNRYFSIFLPHRHLGVVGKQRSVFAASDCAAAGLERTALGRRSKRWMQCWPWHSNPQATCPRGVKQKV